LAWPLVLGTDGLSVKKIIIFITVDHIKINFIFKR
jgi:hypothetical protein